MKPPVPLNDEQKKMLAWLERNGAVSPSRLLAETRLELTYSLDASKSPRTVDLTVVEGSDKGKTYRGIYTLEEDRYKICRTTLPDKDRPTEFGTGPKSGLMMVVWKREKSAKLR